MSNQPQKPKSLTAGSLLLQAGLLQKAINAKQKELEDLRRQRDSVIVLGLDSGITYTLFQKETGLARSALIKIHDRTPYPVDFDIIDPVD